nr:unnamed protein product [Callosobruchus chinensis]
MSPLVFLVGSPEKSPILAVVFREARSGIYIVTNWAGVYEYPAQPFVVYLIFGSKLRRQVWGVKIGNSG